MSTLTFGSVATADIRTLRDLANEIWRAYYPAIIALAQIEHMLATMYSAETISQELARGVVWELVFEAGEPIGFLSFEHDRAAGGVKLHKLYLLPRLHGRGIGQAMIARVKTASAAAGARCIRLQVNRRNTRAILAYERAGFHITDRIVIDIGEGFVMDDLVMETE